MFTALESKGLKLYKPVADPPPPNQQPTCHSDYIVLWNRWNRLAVGKPMWTRQLWCRVLSCRGLLESGDTQLPWGCCHVSDEVIIKRDWLYLFSGLGLLCMQLVTGISRLLAFLLLEHRTRDIMRNHMLHGICVWTWALWKQKGFPPRAESYPCWRLKWILQDLSHNTALQKQVRSTTNCYDIFPQTHSTNNTITTCFIHVIYNYQIGYCIYMMFIYFPKKKKSFYLLLFTVYLFAL